MRWRAIFCALLYGLAPSSWYEPTPHYDGTYLEHLKLNLRYAARWLLHREDDMDRRFEDAINARPVPLERCRRGR
jgi:hypothetical protein